MTRPRDFPISEHFTLREFSVSAKHPELAGEIPEKLYPALFRLVVTALEPLRAVQGPIRVLSGYRSKRLNDAVGGSATSQHMLAEAADISATHLDSSALLAAIIRARLPVGQVIHYPSSAFVHVALPSERYPQPSYFVSKGGVLSRYG